MDTFVFGVGRSGTTMIYRIVQEIYRHLYGIQFDSVYEPFVWNSELFNDFFENTKHKFGCTDSLSIEGIVTHLNIPLFLGVNGSAKHANQNFLRLFTTKKKRGILNRFRSTNQPRRPTVFKLIRCNGRLPLFRRLNPAAKFIIIVRNPVDVLNSVKHKFSFFGEDFYPSDFPRFCAQLGSSLILDRTSASWAEKQAEYSYQMSRAALEYAVTDSNSLIFEYDKFCASLNDSVAELCDFLGAPFVDAALSSGEERAGPDTNSITLSDNEFRDAIAYHSAYEESCRQFGFESPSTMAKIGEKYSGNCHATDLNLKYEGLTTISLRHIIVQKDMQIQRLTGSAAKTGSI